MTKCLNGSFLLVNPKPDGGTQMIKSKQIGMLLVVVMSIGGFMASTTQAATIVGTDYFDTYTDLTLWGPDRFDNSNIQWNPFPGGGAMFIADGAWAGPDGATVGYYTYKFVGGVAEQVATVTSYVYRYSNSGIRVLTSNDYVTWTTQVDNFSAGGHAGGGASPYSFDTTVAAGDDLYLRFEAYDNPNGSYTNVPQANIQDVSVTFIPEPASMGLMVLGGLLIGMKRRSK